LYYLKKAVSVDRLDLLNSTKTSTSYSTLLGSKIVRMSSPNPVDLVYPIVRKLPDLKPLGFLLATLTLSIYLLRQWALPKPIPGIPYNEAATHQVLGDIPAMLGDIKKTEGTFIEWMLKQVQNHKSPISQIFIRPFSLPVIVLGDFREAQDILMRRKEFDRSPIMAEIFAGIAPHHHIHSPTNAVWKSHRRLLQDLMSPGFLHNAAGPVIYANATNLVKLWELKSGIAGSRPFSVSTDIYHAALDAVLGFAFGESFSASATKPDLKLLESLDHDAVQGLRSGAEGDDAPVSFPEAPKHEAITATLDLATAIEEIQGKPLPHWYWKFIAMRPQLRRAMEVKKNYIQQELVHALERLENEESSAGSAVDLMIRRERKLAEKDGREPDYLSSVIVDEVSYMA
jgi:hypothetical protein